MMPFKENQSESGSLNESSGRKSSESAPRLTSSKIPLGLSQACNVVQPRMDSLCTYRTGEKSAVHLNPSSSLESAFEGFNFGRTKSSLPNAARTSLPFPPQHVSQDGAAHALESAVTDPLPNTTRSESPQLILPDTPSSTVWLKGTGSTPDLESTLRSRPISHSLREPGSPLASMPLRLSQESLFSMGNAAGIEIALGALSTGTAPAGVRTSLSGGTRSHDIRPSSIPHAPSAPSSRSNSAARQSLSLRSSSANSRDRSSIPRFEASKENKEDASLVQLLTNQAVSLTGFSDPVIPSVPAPAAPSLSLEHQRLARSPSKANSPTLNDLDDMNQLPGTPLPLPFGLQPSPRVPDSTLAYISTVARVSSPPDDVSEASNCTIGGAISSSRAPGGGPMPADTPTSPSEQTPCSGSRQQGSFGPGATISFNLTTPSTGEPAISSDTPASDLRDTRLALYRNPVSQDYESHLGSCVATEVPLPYMNSPSKIIPPLPLPNLCSPASQPLPAQACASEHQVVHQVSPSRGAAGTGHNGPRSPVPAKFRDLDTSCLQEKLQEAAAQQQSPGKSPRRMWDLPAARKAPVQKVAPVVSPLWLQDVDDGIPSGEDEGMVLGSPHAYFELEQQHLHVQVVVPTLHQKPPTEASQSSQQPPNRHQQQTTELSLTSLQANPTKLPVPQQQPSMHQKQPTELSLTALQLPTKLPTSQLLQQPNMHQQQTAELSPTALQLPTKLPTCSAQSPESREPQDESLSQVGGKVAQAAAQSRIPVPLPPQQSRILEAAPGRLVGDAPVGLSSLPTSIPTASDSPASSFSPTMSADCGDVAVRTLLVNSSTTVHSFDGDVSLAHSGMNGTVGLGSISMDGVQETSSSGSVDSKYLVLESGDDEIQGAITALRLPATYSDLPVDLAADTVATEGDAPDVPELVPDAAFDFQDARALRVAATVPMVLNPCESMSPVPRERDAIETSLASWQTPLQADEHSDIEHDEPEKDVDIMDTPSTGARSPASHGILLTADSGSRKQKSSGKKVAFALDDKVAHIDGMDYGPERRGKYSRVRRTPGCPDKTQSRLPQLNDPSIYDTPSSHSTYPAHPSQRAAKRTPGLIFRVIRAVFVASILLGYTLAFGPRLQQLLHWTAARAVPAVMQLSPDASISISKTLHRAQQLYTGSRMDVLHGEFQQTAGQAWRTASQQLAQVQGHVHTQVNTAVSHYVTPALDAVSTEALSVMTSISKKGAGGVRALMRQFPNQGLAVQSWLTSQAAVQDAQFIDGSQSSLTNTMVSAWRGATAWLLETFPTMSQGTKATVPCTLFISPMNACPSSLSPYVGLEHLFDEETATLPPVGVYDNPVDLQSMLSRLDACCGGLCHAGYPSRSLASPGNVPQAAALTDVAASVTQAAVEAVMTLPTAAPMQQHDPLDITGGAAAVLSTIKDTITSESAALADSHLSLPAPAPSRIAETIAAQTEATITSPDTEPAVKLQSLLMVIVIVTGLLLLVAMERRWGSRQGPDVSVPVKPVNPTRRTSIYTPGASSAPVAAAGGSLASRLSAGGMRPSGMSRAVKTALPTSPTRLGVSGFMTPTVARTKPRPSLIQAGAQLFSAKKTAAADPTPTPAAPRYTPESFIAKKAEVRRVPPTPAMEVSTDAAQGTPAAVRRLRSLR